MLIIFLRSLILYLLVIVVLRVSGKSQVSQLQPYELVLALLIADLAATPLADEGVPLFHGIMPILALLLAQLVISFISLKSQRLRSVFSGKPSIVIQHGKIRQKELAGLRYTIGDLLEQLRLQGYSDLSQINAAILETSGQLSVFPYANARPVTTGDMNINPPDPGLAYSIIEDGKVLYDNLQKSGHDRAWLEETLKEKGFSHPRQVYVLTVDAQKKIFVQEDTRKRAHA
nr:DUF421 domain-containing protein [Maliibacterium massiliense]